MSPAQMLADLPSEARSKLLAELTPEQNEELLWDWRGFWARPNQLAPGSPGAALTRTDWRYWLVQAGRGYGKTRIGTEMVREWIKGNTLVNLVGATVDDARAIMIQGESGILQKCPPDERPEYVKSERKLVWPNGAESLIFTADEPDRLRGKQHSKLWADEAASWRYPDAWDQAIFGLRLGDNPQAVVTTTPKPVKLIRDLVADKDTVVTRGSTYDNRGNLAPAFLDTIIKKYVGTRLGRQELFAELLDDVPGALWTRAMVERSRIDLSQVPPLVRVVIAIDPAVTASESSDETGIGAIGLGQNQQLYVLSDASLRGTPNEWARAACRLFLNCNADRIVAEVNNGGDLVEANLRNIHPSIPFRAVRASRGKLIRAEPVAALFEQNRVHLAGCERRHPQNPERGMFEVLEDQLCNWTPQSGEKSPDRMDWLVWGCYDLLIQPEENYVVGAAPSVRISAY